MQHNEYDHFSMTIARQNRKSIFQLATGFICLSRWIFMITTIHSLHYHVALQPHTILGTSSFSPRGNNLVSWSRQSRPTQDQKLTPSQKFHQGTQRSQTSLHNSKEKCLQRPPVLHTLWYNPTLNSRRSNMELLSIIPPKTTVVIMALLDSLSETWQTMSMWQVERQLYCQVAPSAPRRMYKQKPERRSLAGRGS